MPTDVVQAAGANFSIRKDVLGAISLIEPCFRGNAMRWESRLGFEDSPCRVSHSVCADSISRSRCVCLWWMREQGPRRSAGIDYSVGVLAHAQ